jgi:hypothetical protein
MSKQVTKTVVGALAKAPVNTLFRKGGVARKLLPSKPAGNPNITNAMRELLCEHGTLPERCSLCRKFTAMGTPIRTYMQAYGPCTGRPAVLDIPAPPKLTVPTVVAQTTAVVVPRVNPEIVPEVNVPAFTVLPPAQPICSSHEQCGVLPDEPQEMPAPASHVADESSKTSPLELPKKAFQGTKCNCSKDVEGYDLVFVAIVSLIVSFTIMLFVHYQMWGNLLYFPYVALLVALVVFVPFVYEPLYKANFVVYARLLNAMGVRTVFESYRQRAFAERMCLFHRLTRLAKVARVDVNLLAIAQEGVMFVPRSVAFLQSSKYTILPKLRSYLEGKGVTEHVQVLDAYERCMLALAELSPAEASVMECYSGAVGQQHTAAVNNFIMGRSGNGLPAKPT